MSASPVLFNFEDFNFNSDSAVIDIQAAADTNQPLQKMLYDRKSAAYVLSISTRSLDYLIACKELNTIKLGSKKMIAHSELVRFSRKNHGSVTNG